MGAWHPAAVAATAPAAIPFCSAKLLILAEFTGVPSTSLRVIATQWLGTQSQAPSCQRRRAREAAPLAGQRDPSVGTTDVGLGPSGFGLRLGEEAPPAIEPRQAAVQD